MKKKRGEKLKKQNILVEKNLGKKNVLDFFPQNFLGGRPNNSPPPFENKEFFVHEEGELFGKLGYFHFFLLGKITMKKIPHLLSKSLLPCTQGTYIQEIWYSNFVSQKYPIQKFFYSGVIIIFFF